MPKHDDLADYHAIEQPLVDMRVSQADMKYVAQLPRLIFPLSFFALVIACVHFHSIRYFRDGSMDTSTWHARSFPHLPHRFAFFRISALNDRPAPGLYRRGLLLIVRKKQRISIFSRIPLIEGE